jgi:hypothetical protein
MLALFKSKKLPEEQPQKEQINTCSKCSMTKFVDCLVNGNTHVVDDWAAIFNEYLSISGDTHISTVLELTKSITVIENKLTLIQLCVDQLAEKHHEGLAQQLKNLGFRFSYEDGENLHRELELTVTQSKSLLIQLNQEKAELETLRANETGKASVQDYEKQYSAIEEFKGCVIDPDTYMVSRYAADVSRMRDRYSQSKMN